MHDPEEDTGHDASSVRDMSVQNNKTVR